MALVLPSGPVPTFSPGFREISGSDLQKLAGLIASVEYGITATAGGTKALARALNAATNVITVCATNNDSVILPKGYAGLEVIIINMGAATLAVFGFGTDTINDVATATGVTQATLVNGLYKCADVSNAGVGRWYRVLSA